MKSLRPIPSSTPLVGPRSGTLLFHHPRWVPLRRNPRPPPPSAAKFTEGHGTEAKSAWAPLETHLAGEGSATKGTPVYFEERIEKVIYRCRFLTMLGVIGSLMGSIICFLKGCWYVINAFGEYSVSGASGGKVILMMVEAIDIYLIGTVMFVFGMGLYELFISNLDIAKSSSYGSNLLGLFKLSERPKWLEIQSVNELKTKLGHVIVMVLLVGLFEKSKKVTISSSTDLLCFAASIFLSSSCLYLLSKLHSSKQGKHA